jgi:hypothetical protein
MDLPTSPSSSGWATSSTPAASTPAPPVPTSLGSPQPGLPGAPTPSPWAIPVATEPSGCQVCGSVPATDVTFRQGIGMLFLRRTKTARVHVCRDCGIAVFRTMQSATLLTGWWGFISFFLNVGTLWSNYAQRRSLDGLGEPRPPSSRTLQTPRATPLPPGRPTLLRPQSLGVVAAAIVLVLAVGLIGNDASAGSAPIAVGTCGSVSAGRVHYPLDCSDPAAAERIDAILPTTSSLADCPDPANGASRSARYGLVCWEPV